MCLAAIAIDLSRRFPLVIAANRDEYFKRPAARLAWWSPGPGLPDILGGRDLEAGGSWLGLSAQGRLAFLTNVRNGRSAIDPSAPSRGEIVPRWLAGDTATDRFWMHTALSGYSGFNLIAADFQQGECFWASNQLAHHPQRLEKGVYGLSNASLNTPWPKVTLLKDRLQAAIANSDSTETLIDQLFCALADRTPAADTALPSTGISPEWERLLSSAFIRSTEQGYGTRCSTVIVAERVNKRLITHVLERSFSATGGMALLRRSLIKDWPPRYSATHGVQAAEQEAVTESHEAHDAPAAANESASSVAEPARKTRVRSLLKPESPRRKRAG
jgi:uncharacterized protein with NRDE domain